MYFFLSFVVDFVDFYKTNFLLTSENLVYNKIETIHRTNLMASCIHNVF